MNILDCSCSKKYTVSPIKQENNPETSIRNERGDITTGPGTHACLVRVCAPKYDRSNNCYNVKIERFKGPRGSTGVRRMSLKFQ